MKRKIRRKTKDSDVGCPSTLTDELTLKIRELVLNDWSYKSIQDELRIPAGTWDYWVYADFQGFRNDLQNWKHEKMIRKSENKLDTLIDSDDDKVALNASQFVLTRLNKQKYSERTELTGADGKDLNVNIIKYQE